MQSNTDFSETGENSASPVANNPERPFAGDALLKESSRRKPTSIFKGVRYDHVRRRWIAEVKAAGKFWRQCYSEAEAVAHYNAVARCHFNLPAEKLNNLWKLRPNRGYLGTGLYAPKMLDIDQHEYVLVDEGTYNRCKDLDWFLDWETGRAMVIVDYFPDLRAKDRFVYVTLEDLVLGMPAEFVSGYPLDCRRKNLAAKGSRPHPVKPPENRPPLEVFDFEAKLKKRDQFERSMVQGLEWTEKGEPRDPRVGFPEWSWWLRIHEGKGPDPRVRPKLGTRK